MASRTIKILYLTPSVKLLGARRSLLALASGLSSDFEPVIVCPSPQGLTVELQNAGIPVHIIPFYQWRKGKYFFHRFFSVRRLRRLIAELQPDIVHCNEFHVMPYAVNAVRGTKIPIVTHIRLTISHRQIKKYFLEQAARIILVSHSLECKFHNTGLEDRITVVYNAIDPACCVPTGKGEGFRKEIGVSKSDILVGHLGGIEPRKRQLTTLRAARKVIEKFSDIRFIIAGNPRDEHKGYYEEVVSTAKNLGIADHVIFLPFRKDVIPLYEAIDINVLISAEEGFGRTIIEAGYLGVPSIGTCIGGIPELIEDGKTGFIINLDDVDHLAERILTLAMNPERIRQMGAAARQRVIEHFLLPAHCRKMEHMYRELIAASDSHTPSAEER